eukprot:TRINITY_DN3266_c0_g1_i1.p1 TRINITY_DN3266_c0_g1~~TRINITY_DN3266_c0_g1_i1.p1  ORF type:complete len:585 (-),score=128.25 TRINITY_DN3266_c0_g1_i1:22-1776(-)
MNAHILLRHSRSSQVFLFSTTNSRQHLCYLLTYGHNQLISRRFHTQKVGSKEHKEIADIDETTPNKRATSEDNTQSSWVNTMLRRVSGFFNFERTKNIKTSSSLSPNPQSNVRDQSVPNELSMDPVIKVFTVQTMPNHFLPWQMKPQREITGSGFVISGKRILTNAHVIASSTSVMVRSYGSATKYPATVSAVGHECDLAVLTVEAPEFWENLPELEFGDLPDLQDYVTVVGYPTGGDNISVTGGVVSRIELQQYTHGDAHLPAIQIDAAINPGNSGGPVLMDGKVVGVAFQHLAGAEAMGFIIPVSIIEHFLEDVNRHNKYTGFGHLGAYCQPMEAHSLHDYFGLKSQTGVLVNKIYPISHAKGKLFKDDVILAIDGVPIANDGTIAFRKRQRIFFNYLLTKKFVGDEVNVTVWRNKQAIEVKVPLSSSKPLVPAHQYDCPPSYFVHAGLVFIPLIQPFLHEYGEDWYNNSPRKLCDKAIFGIPEEENEQVVVLSHVLLDKINYGYQQFANQELKAFNGVKIKNLKQLVKLVENNKEPYLRFDLDADIVLIIDAKEALKATERILSMHRIPHAKSPDLHEKEQ